MAGIIECKICGELCKGDIGLRNHMKGRKDHPSIGEYREKYLNGNNDINFKFDFIIPVANINDNSYKYRLRNINTILSVIPKNVNVIIVEQMIDSTFKLYTKKLKHSKDLSITKKLVRNSVFNKGWLYNIGVKLSKTNNIVLAESDISVNRKYFIDLGEYITNNDHKWFFAWNKIIYWNEDFSKQIRVDSPKKGMAEGGFVYFNKDFYWEIGGSNEFFQELGGIDNELATRARFSIGKDKLFEGTINHLWHPISRLKKEKWKYGKYHLRNRILYYQVRNNPKLAIKLLKVMKPGDFTSPIDEYTKNEFFKRMNVTNVSKKKR